jgi:hypothetical protein
MLTYFLNRESPRATDAPIPSSQVSTSVEMLIFPTLATAVVKFNGLAQVAQLDV